jgi:hypothetical protein
LVFKPLLFCVINCIYSNLFLPANKFLSIDSKLFRKIKAPHVANWSILIIKLQLSCVYFFGGIAKIKSDWIFDAQLLKIWLKSRTDIPLLGWTWLLYDLMIPFLLFYKKSQPIAYFLVLIFHVLTATLFNIAMLPWLMIFGSFIFISTSEWKLLGRFFNLRLLETPSFKP